MITLIESIFGSKLGRFLAEALAVGLLIMAVVLHYEHKGAADELTKLQKSSAALATQVQRQNTADSAAYVAAQKANQEKTSEADQRVAAVQSQLADSVRQFDAYRRAHSAVAGASGVANTASPGECGLEDCGAVVERLAVRGNELAGSVGALSADLQSCQRDRDALTGEPK